MNKIYVGTKAVVERPKKGGYLFIHDTVPKVRGAQIFDPLKHSFNPLHNLDYRRSCDFVDIIDALFSRGESTLTKDTGLDYIAERLDAKPRTLHELIPEPDKKATTGHIWAYGKIRRLLRSPVLSRALCGSTGLLVKPGGVLLARIDRAQFGEFDALVIGLLLMAQFKGQMVVPDLGFYGRDIHAGLVRENRLIAGCNFLDELPPKLRDTLLPFAGKETTSGALFDDAELLAKYAGLRPDPTREDCDFNKFVRDAMA